MGEEVQVEVRILPGNHANQRVGHAPYSPSLGCHTHCFSFWISVQCVGGSLQDKLTLQIGEL